MFGLGEGLLVTEESAPERQSAMLPSVAAGSIVSWRHITSIAA